MMKYHKFEDGSTVKEVKGWLGKYEVAKDGKVNVYTRKIIYREAPAVTIKLRDKNGKHQQQLTHQQ